MTVNIDRSNKKTNIKTIPIYFILKTYTLNYLIICETKRKKII